jgi:UDP-N-acetylglucosamine 2-epimerase (non-hydrolysing)
LRDNTERPETIDVGSNTIVGARSAGMLDGAKRMMKKGNGWKNPFGDGNAGRSMIEHLQTN